MRRFLFVFFVAATCFAQEESQNFLYLDVGCDVESLEYPGTLRVEEISGKFVRFADSPWWVGEGDYFLNLWVEEIYDGYGRYPSYVLIRFLDRVEDTRYKVVRPLYLSTRHSDRDMSLYSQQGRYTYRFKWNGSMLIINGLVIESYRRQTILVSGRRFVYLWGYDSGREMLHFGVVGLIGDRAVYSRYMEKRRLLQAR